ncbi:biotin transporter BioY [Bacillus benzoevorans]|uniref:Biotin transporter n=1 Tax=Bacillus benzoevorans TaxID=1456 RepID=A0A7X0HQX2_9BACI|nr:biotin transporter BioY [Bacillus benzoevorans]MBB6445164.1 biotin transport system substrate-specific component [Bacillus benzoevorans]
MNKNTTISLTAIALFAALTAIGAFIRIPLPFVPFTLQVLFVFLAGSLLGSRKGMQSQLVYVGIGLAGLPVFTQGGGIGYFLQPTFGYLLGYIAGAFVVGWLIERITNPKTYHFILANLAGLMVVYLVGVPYLYLALNLWMDVPSSWGHVWMIGFVYSIAGDIVISVIAGVLALRLYKVFHKMRNKQPILSQEEGTI